MNKKGFFITFEGCDGCGKTTQINLVENYLQEKGISVLRTKEPGGTALGEELRNILKYSAYEIDPVAELLLFNASRAQLCKNVILPKIDDGCVVICDRFYHSSIVYQGYGRGENIADVERVCKMAVGNAEPDIVFWLDISAENAFKRKGGADKGERLEEAGIAFHNKVYKAYQTLYAEKKSNIIRIDASRSIPEIFNDIRIELDKFLNSRI